MVFVLLFFQLVFKGRELPGCFSGSPAWASFPVPIRGLGSVETSILGFCSPAAFVSLEAFLAYSEDQNKGKCPHIGLCPRAEKSHSALL